MQEPEVKEQEQIETEAKAHNKLKNVVLVDLEIFNNYSLQDTETDSEHTNEHNKKVFKNATEAIKNKTKVGDALIILANQTKEIVSCNVYIAKNGNYIVKIKHHGFTISLALNEFTEPVKILSAKP